jgi:glycosidase
MVRAMSRHRSVLTSVLGAVPVAALLLLGCGSYSDPLGTPGDPFDPGPRSPGSGYGSGSGGVKPDPGPQCDTPLRRCGHEFVFTGLGGSPSKGDERTVELRGDYRPGAWAAGDPMTFDGRVWRVTVPLPWQGKALYKFYVIDSTGKTTWLADPDNPTGEPDGNGGSNSVLSGLTCEKFTCVDPVPMCDMPTSGSFDWRDAVLYFVFVDRFVNGSPANDRPNSFPGLDPSTNWQGGDWAGVTQKIKDGYFGQLGVNALWVTVPVDQTDNVGHGMGGDSHNYTGYHGYWPRDLSKPDSHFGTPAEFKTLVDEAHRAGIKVLVDYAMNHVHKDSPVYTAHSGDGWFNPLDLGGGSQCLCGSAACGWDGDKAKVCWFTDYLPDFNFANKAARDFSVGNAMKWISDNGIDGFRLDAVKHIELAWLLDLRQRLTKEVEPLSKQHVYLVGETFTGDQATIKNFIDPCSKLDGQFDFPLRYQLLKTVLLRQGKLSELRSFMDNNDTVYGSGLMSTFLGNHDVPRSIHFAQNSPVFSDPWADGKDRNFGGSRPGPVGETEAYERLALGQTLLFTSHGVPLVYYGDEIGLGGGGDPDNRRAMDWNSGSYSGGQKLLLDRMRKLGASRKLHPAFRRGKRTTLSVSDDTWAYKMVEGSDTVYVAINRSDAAKTVSGLPAGPLNDELLGGSVTGPDISVPARSARILIP